MPERNSNPTEKNAITGIGESASVKNIDIASPKNDVAIIYDISMASNVKGLPMRGKSKITGS